MTDKVIDSFSGEYDFLSNFHPSPILHYGLIYPTVENAFQAAKCSDSNARSKFVNLTPGEAKRLGRKIQLREDWDWARINIMAVLVKIKFISSEDLLIKLVGTDGYELIEGNTWGDTFWGVCNGVGENNLGKILMETRDFMKTLR